MTNNSIGARRWYYLHRTSIVVGILFVLVQAMVVVPGAWHDRDLSTPSGLAQFDVWEHGWPFVHLTRVQAVGSQPVGSPASNTNLQAEIFQPELQAITRRGLDDSTMLFAIRSDLFQDGFSRRNVPGTKVRSKSMRHWSNSENWEYFGSHQTNQWHVVSLLLNFVVFLVLLAGVIIASEWLRRQKQKWYQVTLKEVLLVFVLVGCLGAWILSIQRAPQQRYDACKRLLSKVYFNWPSSSGYEIDSIGLNWFERLMDGSFDPNAHLDPRSRETETFPMYYEVESLTFFPGTRSRLDGIEDELNHWAFSKLKHVGIDLKDIDDMRIIAAIAPDHISSIYIGNGIGAAVDLQILDRFKNLKRLSLYSFDFEYSVPTTLCQLDHLRIGGGKNHQYLFSQLEHAKNLRTISLDENAFPVLHQAIPENVTQLTMESDLEDFTANLNSLQRLKNISTLEIKISGHNRTIRSDNVKDWPVFPRLNKLTCRIDLRTDAEALDQIADWVKRQPHLKSVAFWKAATGGMGMKLPKDEKWKAFSERLKQMGVLEHN